MPFNPMESRSLSRFTPLTDSELETQYQAQVQQACDENRRRQHNGEAPDPLGLFTQYFEEQVALQTTPSQPLSQTELDAIADQTVARIQRELDQWLSRQSLRGIDGCMAAAGAGCTATRPADGMQHRLEQLHRVLQGSDSNTVTQAQQAALAS